MRQGVVRHSPLCSARQAPAHRVGSPILAALAFEYDHDLGSCTPQDTWQVCGEQRACLLHIAVLSRHVHVDLQWCSFKLAHHATLDAVVKASSCCIASSGAAGGSPTMCSCNPGPQLACNNSEAYWACAQYHVSRDGRATSSSYVCSGVLCRQYSEHVEVLSSAQRCRTRRALLSMPECLRPAAPQPALAVGPHHRRRQPPSRARGEATPRRSSGHSGCAERWVPLMKGKS